MPVVTLPDDGVAVPLARQLMACGLGIVEVTLRSEFALDAIRAIRREVPDLVVGAGTLRDADDFARLTDAGARFAVSPGSTPALIEKAGRWDLPWLPAASTTSELMVLFDAGYDVVKFFPADSLGGPAAVRAIGGPLPDVHLCPSGGIGLDNFRDYLDLDNVVSVSGSWMVPADALIRADMDVIAERCLETMRQLDA